MLCMICTTHRKNGVKCAVDGKLQVLEVKPEQVVRPLRAPPQPPAPEGTDAKLAVHRSVVGPGLLPAPLLRPAQVVLTCGVPPFPQFTQLVGSDRKAENDRRGQGR